MVDGLEWNVRLSEVDAPVIVEKFRATFETYWADPDFELYERTEAHRARFDRAVTSARDEAPSPIVFFDIHPWPHQREILERLHVERYRHGRWKNLVVAATGTGKTVVAALDYRRLCEEGIFGEPPHPPSAPSPPRGGGEGCGLHESRGSRGRRLRLLFVAHRREILQQSLGTFRTVMHDGSFGELYVDGTRPAQGENVFASVQSLANVDLDQIPSDHFDVVIVTGRSEECFDVAVRERGLDVVLLERLDLAAKNQTECVDTRRRPVGQISHGPLDDPLAPRTTRPPDPSRSRSG